jgi:hypothetical protein
MERILFLWDEVDDVLGTTRRVLRMHWQSFVAGRFGNPGPR